MAPTERKYIGLRTMAAGLVFALVLRRRALIVAHEMASAPRMMKPQMRTVQANPMVVEFRRLLIRIGKMTPPMDEPAMVMPTAVAMRDRK